MERETESLSRGGKARACAAMPCMDLLSPGGRTSARTRMNARVLVWAGACARAGVRMCVWVPGVFKEGERGGGGGKVEITRKGGEKGVGRGGEGGER